MTKYELRQILKIVNQDCQVKFHQLPLFFLSLIQWGEEASHTWGRGLRLHPAHKHSVLIQIPTDTIKIEIRLKKNMVMVSKNF